MLATLDACEWNYFDFEIWLECSEDKKQAEDKQRANSAWVTENNRVIVR